MALYSLPINWEIQKGKIYDFTVGQPVAMRSGSYLMTAFFITFDEDVIAQLVDNDCTTRWYDVLGGTWVDKPEGCENVTYGTLWPEHARWIRLVRSFLEEKLSSEEIIKAEKLNLDGYKLIHRYTGGWKFEIGGLPDAPAIAGNTAV